MAAHANRGAVPGRVCVADPGPPAQQIGLSGTELKHVVDLGDVRGRVPATQVSGQVQRPAGVDLLSGVDGGAFQAIRALHPVTDATFLLYCPAMRTWSFGMILTVAAVSLGACGGGGEALAKQACEGQFSDPAKLKSSSPGPSSPSPASEDDAEMIAALNYLNERADLAAKAAAVDEQYDALARSFSLLADDFARIPDKDAVEAAEADIANVRAECRQVMAKI